MNLLGQLSITRKLTVIIMSTTLAALLLAAGAFVTYELMTYRSVMVQEMTNLAEIMGASSTAALSFGNVEDAQEILNTLRTEPNIVAGAIYDQTGDLFAGYTRTDEEVGTIIPARCQADGHQFRAASLYLTLPIVFHGERIGSILLQADTRGLSDRARKYFLIMALVLGAAAGFAFWISLRLQSVVSRPILNLARTMHEISINQDYAVRVVRTTGDEIGELMDRFNEMLSEIMGRDRALSETHQFLEQNVAELRQEIDERLRVERNLARMAAILEATTDVVATADADGRLFYLNQAGRRLLGLRPTIDLPRMMLVDLERDPEGRRRLESALTEAARDGVWSGESSIHDAQGDVIEFSQVLLAHRTTAGVVEFYSMIARDITGRRHAERALAQERATLAEKVDERTRELMQANTELARASRLKDEFLASMSHELRTPLNAVLGLSEAMQEGVFGPLNERQLQSLRSVEQSGRHLLDLINDILDLSKIEAGGGELELDRVRLADVCRASIALVHPAALGRKIDIQYDDAAPAAELVADRRRLKQILANLLSNAVKFTPEGGQIGLRVSPESGGDEVHLEVWDTGIGIDIADRSRLFMPFVQLDSRLSRQYGGTGLGLALVKRMVDQHGGRIWIEGGRGQGSRFHVCLPVGAHRPGMAGAAAGPGPASPDSAPLPGRVAPAAGAPAAPPIRVLIVDDNELNLRATSEYLEACGLAILPERDGPAAIRQAIAARPDVILMDIQMPGMDGLEATRRLRADDRTRDIPVIALTGLAMPGDRERCLAAGASDYLSKPVRFRDLVELIHRLVIGGAADRPEQYGT